MNDMCVVQGTMVVMEQYGCGQGPNRPGLQKVAPSDGSPNELKIVASVGSQPCMVPHWPLS